MASIVPVLNPTQGAGVIAGNVQVNPSENYAAKEQSQGGQALMSAGEKASQVVIKENDEATNTLVRDALNKQMAKETELRLKVASLHGRDALAPDADGKSPTENMLKEFDDHAKDVSENVLMTPRQRELFSLHSASIRNGFSQFAQTNMLAQQEKYNEETRVAQISTAQDRAVALAGDFNEEKRAYGAIKEATEARAKAGGWSPERTEVELRNASSTMSVGVIQALIRSGNAQGAEEYYKRLTDPSAQGYEEGRALLTDAARVKAMEVLRPAVMAEKAEVNVSAVWDKVGPKTDNDPVKIFDMEKELSAMYKGDPDGLKVAVMHLKERAGSFNAQQNEVNAGNINAIYKLMNEGKGLTEIQKTQQWLDLPSFKQHEILNAVRDEESHKLSRTVTDAHNIDSLKLIRNADQYATASDPDVLTSTSRAVVESWQTRFGREATMHLLEKWDSLQKVGAKTEAKVDKEDFMLIADKMGLHPYKKDNSEEHKKLLGTLQYRVEQLINQEQINNHGPITRARKNEILQKELSSVVTVKGFWSNDAVPVIGLTSKQAEKVIVPDADRKQIEQVMRATGIPVTDLAVRQQYLLKKSQSARLIDDK